MWDKGRIHYGWRRPGIQDSSEDHVGGRLEDGVDYVQVQVPFLGPGQ